MVYGLWQSAAGMAANQYRQNVAANNIANINTVGFKHDLAMLVERPVESREDGDARQFAHAMFDMLSGGTHVRPTIQTFQQGPVMTTGRPLDALIDGKGLFAVQTDEGVRYTRDGNFARSSEGLLVTAAAGHPVLDSSGGTITIPADGGKTEITSGGDIMQGDAVLATLGVVEFDDLSLLMKQGKNLYAAAASATPHAASDSKIVSGALEGSTMDPVKGLVDMIEASRAFQMNANMISMQDTTLGRAVNEIARF